jgi:hypothetical protein
MDTSAKALVDDLNDILSDFKGHMVEAYEEREDEMEEKIDNLIKELNELFSSSYT